MFVQKINLYNLDLKLREKVDGQFVFDWYYIF